HEHRRKFSRLLCPGSWMDGGSFRLAGDAGQRIGLRGDRRSPVVADTDPARCDGAGKRIDRDNMPTRPFFGALLALLPALSFADVAVPDTPAGRALEAWLDAFNS